MSSMQQDFMQRLAGFTCTRSIVGRGATRGLLLMLAALLAGCEGEITLDLAAELPSDPDITQVVAYVRGVELTTSSGSTETLEFRDSQRVEFIELADDNSVLRLFTDEELSEGVYTGVRLLFDEDRDDDAFVRLRNGTQFPLNIVQGDHAALRFEVEDDDSTSEAFTLLLDLRMSLSFDDDSDEYTLTPAMRTVVTADAGRIQGNVSVACPGDNLSRGAVYLFQGRNVTPDDIDGEGVEPFATSPVFTGQGGIFFYALRYLPEGNYTLAVTCNGNDEDPLENQDLGFRNVINVALDERETLTRNLP
jgi:hypothetical protein